MTEIPQGALGLRETVEAYCNVMGVSLHQVAETVGIRPDRLQGFVDYRLDLTSAEIDRFLELDGRPVNT